MHFSFSLLALGIFSNVNQLLALDNGLALKPPMGWLSWVAFGCETNCAVHPLRCISEKLIISMADRMVEDGYKEAGYEYVIIDDCWLAKERDASGRLQADPKRFPLGIKWLASYIHQKGLKFGIYEDYGTKTCAGYPGSLNHVEQDAQTFASWDVDYVKLDGCNIDPKGINEGYPAFGQALNRTGRPMVYSCEWPLYTQMYEHKKPNYTLIRQTCNLWRNHEDVGRTWYSINKIIDYFAENQEDLISVSGAGGWNDPDMLIIGNIGLTVEQAKVQMALWSMWSAPLLMSVDLRFVGRDFKNILLNKKVIAVNQDPLGVMARLIIKSPSISVYAKPVYPIDENTGEKSYALVFLNQGLVKQATIRIDRLKQLGLRNQKGYAIEELFTGESIGMLGPNDTFSTVVHTTGVKMYKATIVV